MNYMLKLCFLAVFTLSFSMQFACLQEQLRNAINTNDVNLARSLFEQGAQANEDNPDSGITLLHSAARQSTLEMVQLLIQQGANAHATCYLPTRCESQELNAIPLVFATHNSDPHVINELFKVSPKITYVIFAQF